MNLPLSVSWNSNLPYYSLELWQPVYLDQKTSMSMQSNTKGHTKTWKIWRSKLQRLTLLRIDTTEEKQTQTWTRAPAQVQTRMQRQLIAASVPPTLPTAVPLSIVSNPASTCPVYSEVTRLTWEKISKLQREDHCFTCKKVGDHRPKCPNGWRLMSVLTNADSALAWVNVSKVTVLQPSHVEAENK